MADQVLCEMGSAAVDYKDDDKDGLVDNGLAAALVEGNVVSLEVVGGSDEMKNVTQLKPEQNSTPILLRSPINKDSFGSVKQVPDYKQDEQFCTKVQVELFCCNVCQECFGTVEEIKKHLQELPDHRAPRKPKEKPYKCSQCDKGYVSEVSLNNHIKNQHKKKQQPLRRSRRKELEAEKEAKDEVDDEEDVQEENEADGMERRTRGSSSGKTFTCDECGVTCPTRARLRIHLNSHSTEPEFECDQCGNSFGSQWLLKQHLKKVHGVERKPSGRGVPSLECDMCEYVAPDMNEFRKHLTTHAGQTLTCRICQRTAADFRRLRKHFRQQHRPGKKWRVCEVCGHKSSGPSSLALHMATHTGDRNFKCDTCGMRFVRKYAMERHKEVKHMQIRRYCCETCGQKFGTNFALQKHEEYHVNEAEKKFVCDHCGERFVRENVMKWHLQYYHGNNPKHVAGRRLPCDRNRGPVPGLDLGGKKYLPFPCTACKRRFSSHAVRERHIRAYHSDDTSLVCKVCGVRFGAQDKYDQHVASHNGMMSHKCSYCEKEFKRDHLRQVHESEKHTGDRPWKCTCCDERFISRARMYAHRLSHYGREIKCDFCDRSFASLPLKKRHMRKHTGHREFQCHICNKEYKQKSNYTAHMKVHTGEKPFQCDQCSERFMDLPSLRKHLNMSKHFPAVPQPQEQQQPLPQIQYQQQQQQQQQQCMQQPDNNVQILPQQHVQQIQLVHPQDVIRAPVMQQPGTQIQQLTAIPHNGEPTIDLVAYNCDVCGQMFLSTDALIAHCQTHVMGAPRPGQGAQRHTGLSLFGVVSEASQYYGV